MVYLDNAATTPMLPEVGDTMKEMIDNVFGNPSSIHEYGRKANVVIEESRRTIASCLNVPATSIFFTSGGTEANNTILTSAFRDLKIKRFVTSPLEHPAILNTLEGLSHYYQADYAFVDVDKNGHIDLQHLEFLLKNQAKSLVSLMHANNEIGNLLPVKEVSQVCRKYNAFFHSDTVQTIGKFRVDFLSSGFDFASCSAHKFHGPKGTGFMYIAQGNKLMPFLMGGGQERGMRAGTENIYGIAAMATALKLAYNQAEERLKTIKGLRAHFIQKATSLIPEIRFNGDVHGSCLPHIINFSLPKSPRSEMLLFNLDISGFAVSGGSACASGEHKGSHVLHALGIDSQDPVIRVSFSHLNTIYEIDAFLEILIGKM